MRCFRRAGDVKLVIRDLVSTSFCPRYPTGARSGVAVLPGGILVVGGCGESLGGAQPCDGNCWLPTSDEQSFISGYCTLAAACCASDGFVQSEAETACRKGLVRGGVSADPSVRAACLAEMRSLSGAPTCVRDTVDLSVPCDQALFVASGPHQPGEACAVDSDCAGAAGTITRCGGDPDGAKAGLVAAVRAARPT